jgi:hypothetical protein
VCSSDLAGIKFNIASLSDNQGGNPINVNS